MVWESRNIAGIAIVAVKGDIFIYAVEHDFEE